jgi:membrane protein
VNSASPLIKLIYFAVRVIARLRAIGLARTAASLAFTTLLALVPLATVAVAFVAQFPVFEQWLDTLERFLLRHMLPETAHSVIHHYIREFTEKSASLTGISIAAVAVTAAMATATIEREINAIWGIFRPRPLAQRVLVYALGLTVGPVLVGATLSVTTWLITQSLEAVPLHLPIANVILKPVPMLFTAAALTLLYSLVPAQPVSLRHAAVGALAAALVFEATKFGFAFYLSQVPTYQLVYGAMAALPVFLIWLYLCWLIVLAGAAITATLEEPIAVRPAVPVGASLLR